MAAKVSVIRIRMAMKIFRYVIHAPFIGSLFNESILNASATMKFIEI